MKRFAVTILLLAGMALIGESRPGLDEFLPVARKMRQETIKESMKSLEALAAKNDFAARALYLIYSRGYYGQPVDYAAAALNFDRIFDHGTIHFWTGEYRNVWKPLRLPPTEKEQIVFINAWGGSYSNPVLIREKFILQGKYPLKSCYQEEMANIGGVGARTLFSEWIDRADGSDKECRQLAIELGCAAAMHSAAGNPAITPEKLKLLRAAADAGHVPAMIDAAAALTREKGPIDLKAARQYLKAAVKKCETYAPVGCKHAEDDLKRAKKLLADIPDPGLTTPELLEAGRKNPSATYSRLVIGEIASRNDHPSCEYFRATREGDHRKALAMKKNAIANGSQEAVRELLGASYAHDPDYWFTLYQAGKLGLPPLKPDEKCGYYEQAFYLLQANRALLHGDEYRKGLAALGAVHPPAQKLYEEQFGGGETEERVTFQVSNPDVLNAEWTELQGWKALKISVKPSEQQEYVDITRKPQTGERSGGFSIRANLSGLNSGMEWADLILPDKSRKRLTVNEYYSGAIPVRMRLNIAPGERNFELIITGL